MKIDWAKKLTSRKFWAAIVGLVAAVCVAYKVPDGTAEQITSIIMAGATLIAYIIGEGLVDAAGASAGSSAEDLPKGADTPIGTVTDTAAASTTATGTTEAVQTAQVTAGLGNETK